MPANVSNLGRFLVRKTDYSKAVIALNTPQICVEGVRATLKKFCGVFWHINPRSLLLSNSVYTHKFVGKAHLYAYNLIVSSIAIVCSLLNGLNYCYLFFVRKL